MNRMNRRNFLGALGAPAVLGVALEPNAAAIVRELHATPGTAAELATDEDYWAQVQAAFAVGIALLAGVVGLYLGGLYLLTGNLLVPIVVHALYDIVALGYLRKAERAPVIE